MRKEVFRMERVTYLEQEITKIEDFNLNIFEGEIMGFQPINRQGLTSFLKLLRTNYSLYDGYIYYNEVLINSWKQSLQNDNRITIIQNISCLVEGLTVADNIFVLRSGYKGEYIEEKVLRKQLEPFLKEVDIQIKTDTLVEKLDVFERIVVELLKGIVAGHKLIVLQEIETLVAGKELKKLHRIMKYYAKKGHAFLYICSHFEEAMELCNRIAIVENGRVEKVLQHREMNLEQLNTITKEYTSLIQGYIEKKESVEENQVIAEIQYQFRDNNSFLKFYLHEGECLVLQCMENQMYYEIQETLTNGRGNGGSYIKVGNKKINMHKNREIAIIQETPSRSMLFPQLSYMDNLCFNLDSRMKGVWLFGNIKKSIYMEYKKTLGEAVFETSIEKLTEKEKYQLVYTRILLQRPKVVFCVQPFQGADLEHRMHIWTLLESLIKKNISVVILAVNLADTLSIADRLIRFDGKEQKEYLREDFAMIPALAPWQYLYKNNKKI